LIFNFDFREIKAFAVLDRRDRSSSGSLAMLAAIRRASSRVIRCAADRRPGAALA
jgi:hypothetical protein